MRPVSRIEAGSPWLADSVTAVAPEVAGGLLITGSHGGLYSAVCALRLRVAAVVFSDAGIGRDEAGVAGVRFLDRYGVPAAAVGHLTARIGDAVDLLARGRLSVVNQAAHACGVRPGDMLRDAWPLLALRPTAATFDLPELRESEHLLRNVQGRCAYALDSNSLVDARHRDSIVVTGSHGGLLGGRPATAVKQPVFAAFYNDAGVGIDQAGIGRLPVLDAQGIAGIAVDASTACIGDGMSTYRDGVASHVNRTATALGIAAGMPVSAIVDLLTPTGSSSSPSSPT